MSEQAQALLVACACGCGQPAPVALRTNRRSGARRGMPQRFIRGHRWKMHDWETNYTEEDRGYGTPCHIWAGSLNKETGYGRLGCRAAHRMFYELHAGPIPEGLDLDHLCRVRQCVRYDHLEAVTRGVNVRRSPWVGRSPGKHALSRDQEKEVLISTCSLVELSTRYNVSREAIRQIRVRARRIA